MLVMTFGAVCSPCISHYVKVTNALSYREKYSHAVKSILDHHYVDDFVDSFPTPKRAIEVAQQVRTFHKSSGFELRNFSSNSSEVIVVLKGTVDKPVNFCNNVNELQTEKILGIYWQPRDDTFGFMLKFHNVNADVIEGLKSATKRELLSVVMPVFDPLGFLSNFMLLMSKCFEIILESVPNRLELHFFVDVSEDAFGVVSYWRSINADEEIEVSIVAAKTRCAPIKTMSIPKLELQAAVLGTQLMNTIVKENS